MFCCGFAPPKKALYLACRSRSIQSDISSRFYALERSYHCSHPAIFHRFVVVRPPVFARHFTTHRKLNHMTDLPVDSNGWWQKVKDVTVNALACGALKRFDTSDEYLEDAGVLWIIRVATTLQNKPQGNIKKNK